MDFREHTDTVHNRQHLPRKPGENHTLEHNRAGKNSAMTLGEKEKSVIQRGAYIVIKSHVKKCKHTPPTLTASVATELPVRATATNSKKKERDSTDMCSKQHLNH